MQNQYLPEGLLLATAQNREAIASQAGLERAMAQGRILEAPAAMCDSDMNLYVDLGGVRGYMPREEVAYSKYICRLTGKIMTGKVEKLYEDEYTLRCKK